MKSFCASMAVISVVGASLAMAAPQAAAQSSSAPTLVRVDGQVKTPTGDARTGSVTLVVSLYAEKEDATPLWVEPQVVTLDAAGGYTIFAGATWPDGVPQAFLSGSTPGRWLGVGVQGEAEQFRMMLVTVPYAAKAREADTLAGKSAADFVLSEHLGATVQAALKADLGKSSSASGGGPGVFGTVNVIQKGAGGAAVQDATGFVEVGGNVGIGTTGPFTLLDLGTGFGAGDAGRKLSLYNDGTFFYGFSVHPGALGISASKTAGAADDVTIPASGNVGIGTASPATLLDVNKSTTGATAISIRNPTAGPNNWARLDIKTDAAGGRGLFDAYSSTFTTSANSVQAGVSFTAIGAGGFSIALQDPAAPMRFYTGAGPSERMRIASTGNVGIGTTNPNAGKLQVEGGNGTAVYANTADGTGLYGTSSGGAGVFGSSSSYIGVWGSSSSGPGVSGSSSSNSGVVGMSNALYGVYGSSSSNIGVYGTGTTGVFGASGSSTGVYGTGGITGVFGGSPSGTGLYGLSTSGTGVNGSSTSGYGVYGYSGSNYAAYFVGDVYVTATLTQHSDARLKQGVRNLGYGLHDVLQLRPVSFTWKENADGRLQLGLIAQEVETVMPELVTTGKDADQTKGINYIGLVPVVIKAIQEQQDAITTLHAENTTLRHQNAALDARVTALEQALHQVLGPQAGRAHPSRVSSSDR